MERTLHDTGERGLQGRVARMEIIRMRFEYSRGCQMWGGDWQEGENWPDVGSTRSCTKLNAA